MKITELLAVMPDNEIAALAIVPAMFIGMRLLYGSWPWESRKTWYRTKPFVPVIQPPEQINSEAESYLFLPVRAVPEEINGKKLLMAPPEQINSEAEEAPHIVPQEQISSEAREATADTDSDHFDRKLMANGGNPPNENLPAHSAFLGQHQN